jgi:glucan phosphorylase
VQLAPRARRHGHSLRHRRRRLTAPPTPTSCGSGARRASEEFDLKAFNEGEYWKAVDDKVRSENISKVLYPADHSLAGKTLRLEQQYFFVSCALQDCIRLLLQKTTIDKFADKYAIQLNDTHPALAVPELMRSSSTCTGCRGSAAGR